MSVDEPGVFMRTAGFDFNGDELRNRREHHQVKPMGSLMPGLGLSGLKPLIWLCFDCPSSSAAQRTIECRAFSIGPNARPLRWGHMTIFWRVTSFLGAEAS